MSDEPFKQGNMGEWRLPHPNPLSYKDLGKIGGRKITLNLYQTTGYKNKMSFKLGSKGVIMPSQHEITKYNGGDRVRHDVNALQGNHHGRGFNSPRLHSFSYQGDPAFRARTKCTLDP